MLLLGTRVWPYSVLRVFLTCTIYNGKQFLARLSVTILARAAALQSVAVRRSTVNDVSGPLFSPLFFILPSSTSTQLNSTQFKSIEVQIALIPISPATHPASRPPSHPKKLISQLLVAPFGPKLKGRFIGPFLTDANCHDDICSGNICPCNNCPYK